MDRPHCGPQSVRCWGGFLAVKQRRERIFGQDFADLDSAALVLYRQLRAANGVPGGDFFEGAVSEGLARPVPSGSLVHGLARSPKAALLEWLGARGVALAEPVGRAARSGREPVGAGWTGGSVRRRPALLTLLNSTGRSGQRIVPPRKAVPPVGRRPTSTAITKRQ